MKKLILGIVLMVAMTLSLTSGCIDKGQLEEGITVPIEVPVDIPIETEINVTIRETIIRVTPTPTPVSTPTPYPTATPIPEMSEDEKLITRYLEMHEFFLVGVCMEYHNGTCISAKTVPLEEAVGYWMEFITLNDLQPVEIYRQSLILYEPSYGYLWAWTYETQYLRKYDYNEEYSYPPLCWEAKNKYNAESIALAGEIRTCSTHAYQPQFYAFGDIEDTRGCIEAQFS